MDKDIRICPEYSNEELYEIIKEREKKMPDREKVIKGLECCCEHIKGMNCDHCPYDEEQIEIGQINQCTSALAYDALALVKEQEHKDRMFHALEDDWKRLKELLKGQEAVSITTDYFDGFGNRTSHCPSCNSRLVWHQNKNYCGECGRQVKWK